LREASTLGLLILLIAAQVVSHKSDPLFRKTDEMVSVSLMNGFRSLAGVSLCNALFFQTVQDGHAAAPYPFGN
jgi:hypothetical protein